MEISHFFLGAVLLTLKDNEDNVFFREEGGEVC